MKRVLIADDHETTRRGVINALAESGLETVGVGDLGDALRMAREQDWDLVILDLDMPGRGGIEALKQLKAERPHVPVLILSMHPAEMFAVRVMRDGAAGFVSKAAPIRELCEAVREALRGGRYISPEVANLLAESVISGGERPRHESLSDRELEVLRLIGSGRTVAEIADELSLAVPTVSTYRARLLEKMGMRNNAELIRYAVEHGLVK